MTALRLAALDAEDLAVVSAQLQDAILTSADVTYRPRQKLVALAVNRFDWLSAQRTSAPADRKGVDNSAGFIRRSALLRIERVNQARTKGLSLRNRETVLSLLAIHFVENDAPAGQLVLTFSGGAEIQLSVECIEVTLTDIGPARPTHHQPAHPDAPEAKAEPVAARLTRIGPVEDA